MAIVIKHPGRLTAAAKRAGESIPQFAASHTKGPKGSIADAARLYENVLKPANKKRSLGDYVKSKRKR